LRSGRVKRVLSGSELEQGACYENVWVMKGLSSRVLNAGVPSPADRATSSPQCHLLLPGIREDSFLSAGSDLFDSLSMQQTRERYER
jgi:hypothetical protein